MGNIDRKPIGRCSQCGGIVSVPTYFMSVQRPVPSCESCGAVMDEAAYLPVVPTIPVGGYRGVPRPRRRLFVDVPMPRPEYDSGDSSIPVDSVTRIGSVRRPPIVAPMVVDGWLERRFPI